MVSPAEPTLPLHETGEPPIGGRWGRYVVTGRLGAGGMGIVLAAHDPALNRKVALKLLQPAPGLSASSGAARIDFEAQAMARLAHPNVVTVYEVDRIGDRPFVAMELVEGTTLRGWLAERPRPWPEIVAMFIAAGRGLAAAHAAGLVHRDFKPDNVLIGRDGRPRVSDFGLVLDAASDPASRSAAASAGVDLAMPSTVGTPAYMAPEQWSGEPVDARGDQFAFCVALWEALHGRRPFPGTTRAELVAAITAGAIGEPDRRTPGWIRAALIRGLAASPDARWPSLDALLRVLRRDPRITRRWIGGGAALAALGAAALWATWPGAATIDPCAGAAARLAGIWDPPRKAAVHAEFAATRITYAGDAWREVSRRIDGYSAGWVDMVGEACRATRVEGRQSDTLLDLRMACLEQRRSVLGALIALWARGVTAETLEHAVGAASGLPALADCADRRGLTERAPSPTEPGRAARVAATRPKLDAVLAQILVHRWADARQAIATVRAEADAAGWPALQAEAALAEGDVRFHLADPGAEAPLLDAARLAGAARDDRLAARALTLLVTVVADTQQNPGYALKLSDLAEGAVARAGDDDELRGQLLAARTDVFLTRGNYDAARAAATAARAHLGKVFGADSFEATMVISDLARVEEAAGNAATAMQLNREALATTIARVGSRHPRVAVLLNNLGLNSDGMGDYEAAARYYRQALDIKQEVLGAEAAGTALTMNNLGIAEGALGHLDAARPLLERALGIRERLLGPEHGYVATTLGNLAIVLRKQGRGPEAIRMLERALAIKTKVYGNDHPSVGHTLSDLADVFQLRGDHARALALYQRALALRRRALGPDHPTTLRSTGEVARELAALHRCAEAKPLLDRPPAALDAARTERDELVPGLVAAARCELASGSAARAVAALERALAICDQAHTAAADRGQVRWPLARARWAAGRRDEAIVTARTAVQELASDADGALALLEARSWLATHPR